MCFQSGKTVVFVFLRTNLVHILNESLKDRVKKRKTPVCFCDDKIGNLQLYSPQTSQRDIMIPFDS